MKGIINLLRVLLIGVWGLVLTVCVSLYFDTHSPRQLPGGHAPWTVADSAMEPSYRKGDLAILDMKQAAEPGDAVLVKGETGLLFRRIIGTTGGQYIFKGDGGEESFLAGAQAVTGVCVAYLPGCGDAAAFLYSLPGILLVAAVGLALIILPGRLSEDKKAVPKASQPVEPAASPDGPPRPARAPRDRYTPRH
ncbi:S24 family peptidase [Oscillospiraceae bacterium 42-9]